METIPVKCDIQNLMKQASEEMKSMGITIGFTVGMNYLHKIAKRAIELNDDILLENLANLKIIRKKEDKESNEI